MNKLLRNILSGALASTLALTAVAFNSQLAFADDGQPPQSSEGQEGVVTSTVSLQGPSKPGDVSPDAYLGGPGGQSGVLSSIIAWWGSTWAKGGSKISLTGNPTAKAWTTLSVNGQQVETTVNNPCWTTIECTSWTADRPAFSGNTFLNFAETTVYWSNNTSSYANATVTKTF